MVWNCPLAQRASRSSGRDTTHPENSINKEPSAELRPGQKDTDSPPPYELLDDILDDYVEGDRALPRSWRWASMPRSSTG